MIFPDGPGGKEPVMRTAQGKEFIMKLEHGQYVSRVQIYEMFGSSPEFRKQVLEFRPTLAPYLGSKCGKRGIEVRTSDRVAEVGDGVRHSTGCIAKSQAHKLGAIDTRELSDERKRQVERNVGFFASTAIAAVNKELKGDAAAKLLGGGK